MVTGALKSQVDKIWETFWSGGIANGLTVIEQLTYLMFAKRLDEIHTAREKKANLLKTEIENPIFAPNQQDLRWSRFKNEAPETMFDRFRDEVFPFIKNLHNGRETSFTHFMKDAVFVIPTPSLLDRVVHMLDDLPMHDRDTKGDVYEYMLGKLSVEGRNGQFRTPRHIIRMMVEMAAPTRHDIIADPACGTAGFLMLAGEYLEKHDPEMFHIKEYLDHYHNTMFHGSDFDASMARIGAMNMTLHGVEDPDISLGDALSENAASIRNKYTLMLANPPFKGSLDYEGTAKDLLQVTKTKKTELLFLALILKQLKPGGRCAVIVPDGVLFGSSKAHQTLRQTIVERHKLDAVISMPSGVFKPYAGVSTAVLLFTRTDSGGTDEVFFYNMQADGYSLDDKRNPMQKNDIPDIVRKFHQWKKGEGNLSDRKAKAFTVPKNEIAGQKYDLSINRYKEIEYAAIEYDPPDVILDQLEALEQEILVNLKQLREMVREHT